MDEKLLWSIGSSDGRSEELVDNYKQPGLLGDARWNVAEKEKGVQQKWPIFHPSEADPEAGYRLHPYTIFFPFDHQPRDSYVLRIEYLVIASRLADLEVKVNGVSGFAYLRPQPSKSGEIRLLSGLHTTIYSDGLAEIIIPGSLLQQGENLLELIARDGGEIIRVERMEAIKRLDRMANGAGLIYQGISFFELEQELVGPLAALELKPFVIYQENEQGALVERCWLYLELNRRLPETAWTLEFWSEDAGNRQQLQLPAADFGHLRCPFDLADGVGEVNYRIFTQMEGELWEQTGTLTRRRKWNVYLTPHAHTDIGYTHRQWEVAERLCRNIDKALDLLADTSRKITGKPKSFTYHLDSVWALETYLAKRSSSRIRQLFEEIKNGSISIPGIYVDLLTQYAALEDLIRNGEFTESVLRPEGLATDFSTVVDVASLTGSLPYLLAKSGIKYLIHANNQDRGPFRLNGGLNRVSPFYWEGAAGGKILVWLAKMYCELRKVCGSPPVLNSAERGLELWLEEYENSQYAPDAVLLYGQEADNTDIDPQPVDFVQKWNDTYVYPRLIPCDVSEFFHYVEQNFSDSLQTVRGDGGAYWEDGVGSSIVPTVAVREAQATLPAAERLEALAVLHTDGFAYPQGHFDEAWKQLLLYDEHTWGAFLSCSDPDALLQQDQWSVKEQMATNSVQWAKRLLHAAAVRHSLNWNNDGREVVVYNPHSWTISGPVVVEIGSKEKAFDVQTGAEIPMHVLQKLSSQALVELWVENLAGLSYRRLILREVGDQPASQPQRLDEQPPVAIQELPRQVSVENRFYKVTFDLGRGCISSWFDLELGLELADQQDRFGFGQFLYAKGGEGTRLVSNQADLPDGNPEVAADFDYLEHKIDCFSFGTSLRLKGKVPFGQLEIVWTLLENKKQIDIQYTYLKQERLEKEAVYIAYPVNQQGAHVYSDSQLGWVNWQHDQLPGGCKEWLPLQTGILISGSKADVWIASPDIPLFCIGDIVRGRWPKELDLTGGRIFSYVLNNYWHTNYKGCQGGSISFQYHLTSARTIAKEEAFRKGWEARRPLYGHRMSFQDFRAARVPYGKTDGGTLAQIIPQQVILSTMKKAKWANGFIVRLQEIAGADQIATLSFAGQAVKRAWLTDLLERELQELPITLDGTLQIQVPAWGLATVRLEFKEANQW